ncbi:MAG: hypothetical protein AVDCRST_MAG33-1060, partial [uncultured Thermomicrobiales bacterium]
DDDDARWDRHGDRGPAQPPAGAGRAGRDDAGSGGRGRPGVGQPTAGDRVRLLLLQPVPSTLRDLPGRVHGLSVLVALPLYALDVPLHRVLQRRQRLLLGLRPGPLLLLRPGIV